MQPKNLPKKPSLRKLLNELRQVFLKDLQDRTLGKRVYGWIIQAKKGMAELRRARDVIKNNYELGIEHYRLGNINDAILRLNFVTWLDPNHATAWYVLGLSYMAAEKHAKAKKAFARALQLKPDWQEARDMLAACK